MTLNEIREMIAYCGTMMNRIENNAKVNSINGKRYMNGREISEHTSYYQRQCKYKSMLPLV